MCRIHISSRHVEAGTARARTRFWRLFRAKGQLVGRSTEQKLTYFGVIVALRYLSIVLQTCPFFDLNPKVSIQALFLCAENPKKIRYPRKRHASASQPTGVLLTSHRFASIFAAVHDTWPPAGQPLLTYSPQFVLWLRDMFVKIAPQMKSMPLAKKINSFEKLNYSSLAGLRSDWMSIFDLG